MFIGCSENTFGGYKTPREPHPRVNNDCVWLPEVVVFRQLNNGGGRLRGVRQLGGPGVVLDQVLQPQKPFVSLVQQRKRRPVHVANDGGVPAAQHHRVRVDVHVIVRSLFGVHFPLRLDVRDLHRIAYRLDYGRRLVPRRTENGPDTRFDRVAH